MIVDNAWNRDRQESEASLAKGEATLEQLVPWFLYQLTAELQQRQATTLFQRKGINIAGSYVAQQQRGVGGIQPKPYPVYPV